MRSEDMKEYAQAAAHVLSHMVTDEICPPTFVRFEGKIYELAATEISEEELEEKTEGFNEKKNKYEARIALSDNAGNS